MYRAVNWYATVCASWTCGLPTPEVAKQFVRKRRFFVFLCARISSYGTFFSNLYFCQAPNELVPFLPQKGQACTAPAWPLLHYFSNQTPKTSKWPAGRYFSFRRSPFLSIYLCSSVDGSQSSIYLSSRVLKAAHKGEKLLGPSRGVFSCSLRPVKVMTLLARRRS